MEKEIEMLEKVMRSPKRPFMAIIGGAKVSSKIGVLKALAEKADILAIGGAMAFTFLKAEGGDVGQSPVEPACFEGVHEIIAACHQRGVILLLPLDLVVARSLDDEGSCAMCAEVPAGYSGFDVGPLSIKLFIDSIARAKTIFWNGPMGVFERPFYAKGTQAIAQALINCHGITVVGGGETVAAIKEISGSEKITHLSTGGGAALEFIEGKSLPGIKVLEYYLTENN
jgi:phosphoglycerate kinase